MRNIIFKKRGFTPHLLRINYHLFRRSQSFKGAGFTIIEMMVTLSIVTLLAVMVLAYSRQSERVTNLIRDSNKMVYELRRAQNLAMLTLQRVSSQPICGWGIYINKDAVPQTQYILFSDFCDTGNKRQYNSGEDFETVNLLKGVEISETNIFSVAFVPPEPQVKFNPSLSGDALITMCLETDPSNCFTIHITSAGQISKEKL